MAENTKIIATHKVVKGDTPWDLARRYYGLGTKWPVIMEFNSPEQGKPKTTLLEGETIKIPELPVPPEENQALINARLVKIDIANLEGRKLLQENVTMLNGVSAEAARVLEKHLKIISIFDLAMSHYFNVARSLVDSGSPLEAAFLQHGFIPGDAFRGDPKTMDLSRLRNADIGELNFAEEATADELKCTLQITTIRDMALWPPFQNARQILLSTFDPADVMRRGEDPEAPSDLVPATGNFPTECVYYTSVFLDEIGDQGNLKNVKDEDFEGVSLFGSNDTQGFTKPAKGGILTYKQSWYAQGVTLGQLLHSLALAPGESTRIAMVDWYRRTGEKTTEEIVESEALSQTSQQARSISEITHAVATEMQHGSNRTAAASLSARAGAGGFGWAVGISSSASVATSVSSSFGQRNMAADMNQQIRNSTQQNATAERSRRATIVRECYQQENETLTTRAVTNYNHMHAMTVQYYEVVQVYRVKTVVSKAERVLFIPMEAIEFSLKRVLARYKELLKSVAVNEEIRNKLDAWQSSYADLTLASGKLKRIYHSPLLLNIEYDSDVDISKIKVSILKDNQPDEEIHETSDEMRKKGRLTLDIALSDLNMILFEYKELSVSQEETPKPKCRIKYEFEHSSGRIPDYWDEFNLPVTELVDQANSETEKTEAVDQASSETQKTDGKPEDEKKRRFTVPPVKVIKATFVPELEEKPVADLIQHLKDTPHYSHAIWLSLDSLTLSQILARYKYGDTRKPLASQVDPTPVAITGNYLGFRWPAGNDEVVDQDKKITWQQKVMADAKQSEEEKENEVEIPLPSGGVFAEAVLGRFNSAEKLDITRYWNWQDSPIPFTASDIAALSAGGKSEQSTLTPGQLSQPAVSINTAPSLPDPTGMRDMMQAIAVSNMFRDMSNQAATAALAGQGLEIASKGAGEAAEQASKNYQTTISTLGEVAKEVIPLVATKGLSAGSISKVGAAANLASKIDEKESSSPDGDGTGNQEAVLSSLLGGVSKVLKRK